MNSQEEIEKKTSKYSSGINIIMRLDELWKNCAKFKRNGQYSKWNDELDTIWLELARDLDGDEFHDQENDEEGAIVGYKTKFKEFDKKLKKFLPFQDYFRGFKKPTKEDLENRENQYEILMEKQLFLARLENHIGKGTSWGEKEDDWD